MPDTPYSGLKDKITEAIANTHDRESLVRCMKRGRDTRLEAIELLPHKDAFRKQVKAAKIKCIEQKEELLDRFVANVERRGATVFMAEDAQAVIDYVLKIAKDRGAQSVSKSKSLTTEEIEINKPMQDAGLRVVETDLGELIIQLVDEKPFHLVFPSVHKTAKDVAEIFEKETGKPVSSDIDEIMGVVRKYLRPIFLNTDIGMTGANIGIAETGGIVIETNEGNGRLVSSIGDCHICVMGSEKIVETIDEALLMVLAHPVSASGQCPTTYVTWMHGRSPMGEGGETPRESHIIILDNGRTKMRDDPAMREALHCIRCGACMNICPTYGVVGGHTFGHIYPGPIGIPWTEEVHGLDKAAAFAPLCISCGLCKEICPADIDMPLMIAEVKQRAAEQYPPPTVDRVMMAADRFAALGSATAPISNWFLRNRAFRVLLEGLLGVDRRRKLPTFDRRTLAKRFKARPTPSSQSTAKRKVVLFMDVYANYNAPDLGMKAIERLEAAGCRVEIPTQRPCGYPFIAYGDLKRARETALYNVQHLASYVQEGYDVVALEPTAVFSLKHSYPKLLDNNADAERLSEKTFEIFEYLIKIEEPSNDQPLAGKRYGFHCACHQRPLGNGDAVIQWLRGLGAEIERIETGTCCGMGGTFGLKKGPLGYDLANAVGEPLFEAFREAQIDAIVTESSVCSIHISEGTGIAVLHPLDLLP